jgi:tripartite-type tricarboxylate transporter receptor subunit TctC
VPKGTPKDVIAKLNATMTQVLFDPNVRQRFAELGIEMTPIDQQSPEALRASEGRSRALVADHEGREHQGGVTTL